MNECLSCTSQTCVYRGKDLNPSHTCSHKAQTAQRFVVDDDAAQEQVLRDAIKYGAAFLKPKE